MPINTQKYHYSLTQYPIAHYSLLITHYSILVIYCSLLITHYPLLIITHYSLIITRYSLLVTHFPLLITHYSLLATHYSSLVIHYSLLTREDSHKPAAEHSWCAGVRSCLPCCRYTEYDTVPGTAHVHSQSCKCCPRLPRNTHTTQLVIFFNLNLP